MRPRRRWSRSARRSACPEASSTTCGGPETASCWPTRGPTTATPAIRTSSSTNRVRSCVCPYSVRRGDPKTRARTLAFWSRDRFADNVEYDGTEPPCRKVLAGEIRHYSKGVQQLFPKDHDLVEMHAEGYLGLPLYDASGTVIGHLAV